MAVGEVGIGEDPLECAFQLAHVGLDMLGDEECNILRHAHALGLRLLEQDRDAHFQFRRLDRNRQAPAEARDQPVFHSGDLLRIGVAGDDHLLVRIDQRIEGVEEFLLRAVLSAEELNIVDQQQIQRVVVLLEAVERLVLIGAHDIGHILFRVDVAHVRMRIVFMHQVADRLDQMRLAQADAAVDEQRVVGGARMLGDLQSRCTRQLVGLSRLRTNRR